MADDIKNLTLEDVQPFDEAMKQHIAKEIETDYSDEFDFSGMTPDEVLAGHRKRFGADMSPQEYDTRLRKAYLADYTPHHPVLDATKELAVGAAPFALSGAAHALAGAGRMAAHIPLLSEVGAGAGHGVNLVLNAQQAEKTAEQANKITDIDPIQLRNDYYQKLYPGLSAKGWSDEDILQVAKERALNVLNGAYQTATSMNRAEETNYANELAATGADLATFGLDGRPMQSIIGSAMKRFGLDAASRTTAAKAIAGPIVQHALTGATYGATDLGLRTLVGGKAQEDLMRAHGGQFAVAADDIAKELVKRTALGTVVGAGFGGVLGGGFGALEAAANAPMTIHELKVTKAWNDALAENRVFENKRAAALEDKINETAKNFNPNTAELPQGATPGDIATSVIEKEHGTDAANSEAGLRAATQIEKKLRLYTDANEEMARAAGTGVGGGEPSVPLQQPAGSTGTIDMAPEAAPSPGLVPAGPMPAQAPVAGPVLGGIETGGTLPPALTPQGETVLPGRAPLEPVRPLPPEVTPAGIRPEAVPPGRAGGEAPIMRLEQPSGGAAETFGERNIPAPPEPKAPPTTEQLAEGWTKELGFNPKKPRAKAQPKAAAPAAAGVGPSLREATKEEALKPTLQEAATRVPAEVSETSINIGQPSGEATAADMHMILDEAVRQADEKGLPVTAELTRVDVPKGGRIPVEKQFAKFWEPRGFKMTDVVRSPEGQIQTARLRRDAIPPPKGGMLEAQGTMYERIARRAENISKAAAARLNKKLGRSNVGFDPTMIGDAALELTGAMFARGIRGAEAMGKYLVDRYGSKVKPHLDKIIELAGKHFTRFFKSDTNATEKLQELLDLHESGKYGMDWYEKTADWAKKHAGRDADMFLRFLAVTSANGQTESGAALALKAFAQWKSGLKFTGMRGPSMVGQLERIAKGENLGDQTKIENFYQALAGNPDAVVLDRWMMRAMGIANRGDLTPKNYQLYSAGIKHLARLNDMTPRQFQAAVWEGARVMKAHEAETLGGRALTTKSGSARPLEDLLARKMDGMSFKDYVGAQGEHLQRMENIYKALEPVRKGESFGHTFNLDTMEPDTSPGYVVSLVSTNVPKSVLYPNRIDKVINRTQPLIDQLREQGLHPTIGVFASELHPGQFSIDLNITLPDKARALAIGTANRQESIAHLGDGGQWIENLPTDWDRKGKQFLPPKDGRLHREWYAGQIARVNKILQENP